MCWHVVYSAPCRAEKASRHARSSARMRKTHRACCAILSPSQLMCSSAGPAFPAPSIALASMIQVTTAKMVCVSFHLPPLHSLLTVILKECFQSVYVKFYKIFLYYHITLYNTYKEV